MTRKILRSLAIFILAVSLAGCVKYYTVQREREDQELSAGNQGFLQGAGTTPAPTKTTRTIHVIETQIRSPFAKEKELNLAPVTVPPEAEEVTPGLNQPEPKAMPGIPAQETKKAAVESNVATYTVGKGDTLEKIAGRPEIYGNPKKWYRIYKANKDKLKSPNHIYPGQVLNIPRD